ncbi:MAG: DUF805 domain-containing protein [Bacteroidales bacterium]|nr:DUF805 domain-containing protein [Bacteroidales bacterium]
MIDNFKKVVCDNYANFSGRARRREFWLFHLFYMIISIILGFVLGIVGVILGLSETMISIPIYVLGLALFIPSIAVAVRRLHDTGKSGWYYLVGLIPFIGALVLLYWFVTEGTEGSNEYGENPKKSLLD